MVNFKRDLNSHENKATMPRCYRYGSAATKPGTPTTDFTHSLVGQIQNQSISSKWRLTAMR